MILILQMTWIDTGGKALECVYSGSGKTPLLCASSAFVGLALAMMVAIVSMIVQGFFAYRIYMLSHLRVLVAVILMVSTCFQCLLDRP